MEEVTVVRTGTFRETALGSKAFGMVVGARGFEPRTSCAQDKSNHRKPLCFHRPFCKNTPQAGGFCSHLFPKSVP